MFDKIKEFFQKIKQDLNTEEENIQKEEFPDETFYVQNVQYTPDELEIVNNCKHRLHALGVEEIEIDGICTQYWLEITEAFELMEKTFPCLRGYVKRIQLVEVEESFMYIRIPTWIENKETEGKHKYLTRPTLNISSMFLDKELTEQELKLMMDNGHSKLYSVYATTIHELSHFLEQVIVIMLHGYDFYDQNLTENNLDTRASSFATHNRISGDIAKILEYMNMKNVHETIEAFKTDFKKKKNVESLDELNPSEIAIAYFNSVDKILKGYHYAFTNDSEFFAEMIATKMEYGDKADDFILQYFETFQNIYSWLFNSSFEDYKQAENKIRYIKKLKSLS